MQADQPPVTTDLPDVFSLIKPEDVDRLCVLGEQFFQESEFPEFATYNPEGLRIVLENTIGNPRFQFITFRPVHGGPIEGFIAFQVEASYTVEPLALGYLFYVTPGYRRSPAGRLLQQVAVDYARALGCVAFYNGCMSGIEAAEKAMPNMYRKLGFKDLYWGRKLLLQGD
jgi:GNAT superfamily N-acetyltransferase